MSIEAGVVPAYGTSHKSYEPWLVCFSASLFFFFEFMNMNIFNSISQPLMQEFHLTAGQLGRLSASYYYGNVLLLLPAGIILDRVSTRKLILFSMAVCVIGTFIFATAQTFWIAAVGRFAVGIVGAFCFLGNVKLASRWFPPNRLALVIGLIVTVAFIGGLVAQTPMTIFVNHFGWRNGMMLDGVIGLLILVMIFLFVRDYPKGQTQNYSEQHDQLQNMGFFSSLKKALGNLQSWLGGIYTSLMNLPVILLGAIWGNLYLVQVHHLTSVQASYVTSMIFFGTMFGSPLMGWISDRMGRRKKPMIVATIASIITVLGIIYLTNLSLISLMILFLALGVFTSAQIISYPMIAESNPKFLTGTSMGIASVLIQSGGFTQAFFGFLMGLYWSQTTVNGVAQYSLSDYRLAMLMLPAAFIIALLAVLKMRETYCRSLEEG